MARVLDIDDLILNYDPESPPPRFAHLGLDAMTASFDERLPRPVPWPHSPPTAVPLSPPPRETDSLARFAGYDAVVMTWTAAEAAALAAIPRPIISRRNGTNTATE